MKGWTLCQKKKHCYPLPQMSDIRIVYMFVAPLFRNVSEISVQSPISCGVRWNFLCFVPCKKVPLFAIFFNSHSLPSLEVITFFPNALKRVTLLRMGVLIDVTFWPSYGAMFRALLLVSEEVVLCSPILTRMVM